MTCRWNGTGNPRTLAARHEDDCHDETCRGCAICPDSHCRCCGIVHVDGTNACPGCLDEARTNLAEIARMTGDLPAEAEVRGVDGEAMALLGPVANAEARQHWEASVLAGRITPMECDARELEDVAAWLEKADDERHPLLVIGSWSMVYRDAFEHDEPAGRVELANEIGYLSRNLTYMGGYEWVPFEDFAADLRRCVGHLEAVLHDGEQVDRGVGCMTCRQPLTRVWSDGTRKDGWECKRCREFSTEDQYRFAVKADYIKRAEWLTDVDMATRVPTVTAATVRSWASEKGDRPVLIRKTRHTERTVYSVEDVVWIDACRRAEEHAA